MKTTFKNQWYDKEHFIIQGKKYPRGIFEKETSEQREDRRAMEGKILIYDEHCEKCGKWAQYCIERRYFCKTCSLEFKKELKEKKNEKILYNL